MLQLLSSLLSSIWTGRLMPITGTFCSQLPKRILAGWHAVCCPACVHEMPFSTVSCFYKTGVLQQQGEIYNSLSLFLDVRSSSDAVWALFLPLARK